MWWTVGCVIMTMIDSESLQLFGYRELSCKMVLALEDTRLLDCLRLRPTCRRISFPIMRPCARKPTADEDSLFHSSKHHFTRMMIA